MSRSAPEKHDLAEKLEVTIRTLRDWEKREGFPKGGTLEQIAAWRDRHGLGKGAGNRTIAELRADKLAVETRLLHLKEKQAKAELVEVSEVRAYLAQLGAKFDLVLTQKLDTELPPRVIGKDIVAVRAEVLAMHDEIRAAVNSGISQWTPPPR